jgi:hypothetical protein
MTRTTGDARYARYDGFDKYVRYGGFARSDGFEGFVGVGGRQARAHVRGPTDEQHGQNRRTPVTKFFVDIRSAS